MRILQVGHHQLRKCGNIRVSWTQKLFFGLVKDGHCVQPFSDRDMASFYAPLRIRELGRAKSNSLLLKTAENFEPDLVIVGHSDIITNETLIKIREMYPDVKIAGANCDPLFVPENVEKIKSRCEVVDAMFVSTGLRDLKIFEGKKANVFHMPNPVDSSIETFDVSKLNAGELKNDLIFVSKATDNSDREKYVKYVKSELDQELRLSTPGNYGQSGVWGREYDHLLSKSKMGLNLNRQEGYQWYSSDRIVQLVGNGLLTFTHKAADLDEIIPEGMLVYFKDKEELVKKIREFNADDQKRKTWASRAREFFHREFSSTLYARYIVESTFEKNWSYDYIWVR